MPMGGRGEGKSKYSFTRRMGGGRWGERRVGRVLKS
jgi:hypothetical protein